MGKRRKRILRHLAAQEKAQAAVRAEEEAKLAAQQAAQAKAKAGAGAKEQQQQQKKRRHFKKWRKSQGRSSSR